MRYNEGIMQTICTPDFAILQVGAYPNNVAQFAELATNIAGDSGDGSSYKQATTIILDDTGHGSLQDQTINGQQNVYYKFVLRNSYTYTVTVTPNASKDVDIEVESIDGGSLIFVGASEQDGGIPETLNLTGYAGLFYMKVYCYSQTGATYSIDIQQDPASYSLNPSITSMSFLYGNSQQTTITLLPHNGYSDILTLSASFASPQSGLIVTPTSATIDSSTSPTFTVAADKTVPAGQYTLNITSSDGLNTISIPVNISIPACQFKQVSNFISGIGTNAGVFNVTDNMSSGRKFLQGYSDSLSDGTTVIKGKVPVAISALNSTTNHYQAPSRITASIDGGTVFECTYINDGTVDVYSYINDGIDFSSLADGMHQLATIAYDSNDISLTATSSYLVANNPPVLSITTIPSTGFATIQFNVTNLNSNILSCDNIYIGKLKLSFHSITTTFDNNTVDATGNTRISGVHYTFNSKDISNIMPGLNLSFYFTDTLANSISTSTAADFQYPTGSVGTVISNPDTITVGTLISNKQLTTTNTFYKFHVDAGKTYKAQLLAQGKAYSASAAGVFAIWTPDGYRWSGGGSINGAIVFTAETSGDAILIAAGQNTLNVDILVTDSSTTAFRTPIGNGSIPAFNLIEDDIYGVGSPYVASGDICYTYSAIYTQGIYHLNTGTSYTLHITRTSTNDEGKYCVNEKCHVIIYNNTTLAQVFTYDADLPSNTSDEVLIPFTVSANNNYTILITRNGIDTFTSKLSCDVRVQMSTPTGGSRNPYNSQFICHGTSNPSPICFDAGNGETITITSTRKTSYTNKVILSLYDHLGNLLKTVTGTDLDSFSLSYTFTSGSMYYYTAQGSVTTDYSTISLQYS